MGTRCSPGWNNSQEQQRCTHLWVRGIRARRLSIFTQTGSIDSLFLSLISLIVSFSFLPFTVRLLLQNEAVVDAGSHCQSDESHWKVFWGDFRWIMEAVCARLSLKLQHPTRNSFKTRGINNSTAPPPPNRRVVLVILVQQTYWVLSI